MFGRTEVQWEQLVAETVLFLEERAVTEERVTYTDLNRALVERTGQRPFDFSEIADRSAVGELLGEAVDRTWPDVQAMISAIMYQKGTNDPGPGFYALAAHRGLLTSNPNPDQKTEFWLGQLNKVRAHYGAS